MTQKLWPLYALVDALPAETWMWTPDKRQRWIAAITAAVDATVDVAHEQEAP